MRLAATMAAAILFSQPAAADWIYKRSKDAFTDAAIKLAVIDSKPYPVQESPGSAKATLYIRMEEKKGLSVWVSLGKGLFGSATDGNIDVRFDDGKPMRFWTRGASDGSLEVFFIPATTQMGVPSRAITDKQRYAEAFVQQAMKATRIRFDATIYREGRRVLDFETGSPLVWDLPQTPAKRQ